MDRVEGQSSESEGDPDDILNSDEDESTFIDDLDLDEGGDEDNENERSV